MQKEWTKYTFQSTIRKAIIYPQNLLIIRLVNVHCIMHIKVLFTSTQKS